MPSQRRQWTSRQREQLQHLAQYVDYFKEKLDVLAAKDQPIPGRLREAIKLLPGIKRQIEKNEYVSSAELWHDIESRIVEWHIQESKQWRPRLAGPRPDSPRT